MADKNLLSGYREALREKRAEIMERSRSRRTARPEPAEPEVEFEEQAQQEKSAQALGTLEESEQAMIASIDRAMGKVAAGTYGICETCGRPIPRERLDAIPWATRCVECCTEHEKTASMPAGIAAPEGSLDSGGQGKSPKEVAFQGEDVNEDVFESLKQGTPLSPSGGAPQRKRKM